MRVAGYTINVIMLRLEGYALAEYEGIYMASGMWESA